MNRLLVALLAAFDAVIAVAVGVAAALAPLTVLWAVAFDGGAAWDGLWPAAVRLWQLGHLVPLEITLPQEYALGTGLGEEALSFSLSLAPLAFGAFTAVFAARSGTRAARAGAAATGVVSGSLVVAALATMFALTSTNVVARVEFWQAVLLPVVVFAVPALLGAVARVWRDGDDGIVDAVYVRLDRRGGAVVASAIGRGVALATAGFVGIGALVLAVALFARGGDVVALYQASHVDALGATAVTLGQLAYLPILVVWAGSFAAGPGFDLGAGSTVAASGTQLGVIPGIPVLGAVPPATPPALLLLALLFVAVGFLAGSAARSRIIASARTDAAWRPGALEPMGPRLTALAGVVVLSGAAVAILAVAASGALGPDRLAAVGPEPGPLALAFAFEIGIGAAIALLGPGVTDPRARADASGHPRAADDPRVE